MRALLVMALLAAPGASAPLLDDVSIQYRQAVIAHDAALAGRLRTEVRLLAVAHPSPALAKLERTLTATRDVLHPWPLAATVARQAAAAGAAATPAPADPYGAARAALTRTQDAPDHRAAVAAGLDAYAATAGVRRRLGARAGELDAPFFALLTALDERGDVGAAVAAARSRLSIAQQTLGDVKVSKGTVVTDAAILVFREGLEAVLILAAITASFVGAKRHLRRPVLLGGVAGLGATIVTWALVQLLVSELGTGGLRLEAITGILAIAVLLVVTNWFFHRVYWSQWIARFNRRRKALEKLDRFGVLSGQAAGLALLGLTSVYREGFETVLFVQNLQVSAGTGACVLGSSIGLAATLAVGAITFAAQRKLPYKKMLIATGVLIAVVLAVMTGTTVHVLQGLGWLPATPAAFDLPIWANSWLGLYATWEGLAAQALALLVVLGSYFAAREIQVRAPQRRVRREAVQSTT